MIRSTGGSSSSRAARSSRNARESCGALFAARCTRELEEPLERDLYTAMPVKYSTVVAPGMRMAIVGAEPLAHQSCLAIAAEAQKQSATPVACRRAAL